MIQKLDLLILTGIFLLFGVFLQSVSAQTQPDFVPLQWLDGRLPEVASGVSRGMPRSLNAIEILEMVSDQVPRQAPEPEE